MHPQSSKLIIHHATSDGGNAEFHHAVEEFAPTFFESELSISSSSDLLSELNSPESPSSPSSSGLRHRRLASQRSEKGISRSQFFKNNPDGLIDFDQRKNHNLSRNLKDLEKKLNGKSNSGEVDSSSAGDNNRRLNDETDSSSVITSVDSDDNDITLDSPVSIPYILSGLAELVIKAVGFQSKFLTTSVTFPIWLMHSSYMFAADPFGVTMLARNRILAIVWWIMKIWNGNSASRWKLFFRVGWGLLWFAYSGFVLIALLVPAFLVSGMMMKRIVQEPIQITEPLTFDYSKDAPVAFVPISSCPESSFVELGEKIKIGSVSESRVIPFDHELHATVSLTLPESDYNRNLGIFQVRIDFLSGEGNPLGSIRQPCMLQFKSEPIRLLSTFLKLAPLLTGYSSESQTLDIKFKGYTEKDTPTSCSRVVLEKRAEFGRGGGLPELYAASIKLESQLPFLKRMLWYWKGVIYIWMSIMMFMVELVFMLLCCVPIVLKWLRSSNNNNNNVYRNAPRGRS